MKELEEILSPQAKLFLPNYLLADAIFCLFFELPRSNFMSTKCQVKIFFCRLHLMQPASLRGGCQLNWQSIGGIGSSQVP